MNADEKSYVFQLVDQKTGCRTQVITMKRKEFAKLLQSRPEGLPEGDAAYVLILAEVEKEDNSFAVDFSQIPMMSINHFVKLFGVSQDA